MKKAVASQEKSKSESNTLSNPKNEDHTLEHKLRFSPRVETSNEAPAQVKRWNPCEFYYY